MTSQKTLYRICPVCEAGCGLKLDVDGRTVLGVRGNDSDVFSGGHLCAKGIALKELDSDPDRLRSPLLRKDGELVPVDWPTAWAYIAERLNDLRKQSGDNAVATYLGNPTAHNVGISLGMNSFMASLGSTQIYSAGTVDQVPKQLASALMFGHDFAIPVPDIERCDYLLMLGANPVVSNGSLWVVPKIRDKLRALRERGGQLTVIDPRRNETARLADRHHFIRPGTDAWLLAALSNELSLLGREIPQDDATKGGADLRSRLQSLSCSQVATITGLSEDDIRGLAQELDQAKHPVLYGRIGTTLQQHGTLTSFLLEVIHLQLGVLDQEGGAMFPEQPYFQSRPNADVLPQGRWHSRVSNYPEVLGQMPVAALAEEIDTPGDGQIRALVCVAGNPIVSNPDSVRLEKALESLDFLVCIDIYHSETSRLADVVLPGTPPFEDSHYDYFLGPLGYKNAARYSPAAFESDQPDEWDIGLTFGHIATTGKPPTAAELANFEDNQVAAAVSAMVNDAESGIAGADPQHIMGLIEPARGVERMLDLGIRAGRWGDHFGKQAGLTLNQLAMQPDGIDLGALRADRLQELIGFSDRKLNLAPDLILSELDAIRGTEQAQALSADGTLSLIGRRNTRTNNSWLRNLPILVRGKPLCTLQMHSADAQERDVNDGDQVQVSSAAGKLTAAVEVDDAMMPGVVSLPHGFSLRADLQQNHLQAGPNYNVLAASTKVDAPSGTAALNGISVQVEKTQLGDIKGN